MTNKAPFMSIVMFAAVKKGDFAEVERLLDAGADVGVRDDGDGFTPLHYACFLVSHPNSARLLIERGADVGARDKHNNTPLDYACDLPEDSPDRQPLLEVFRDLAPEACFTRFCESPGRMPGRER